MSETLKQVGLLLFSFGSAMLSIAVKKDIFTFHWSFKESLESSFPSKENVFSLYENVIFFEDLSAMISGTFSVWEGVDYKILSLKILDPISHKNLITLW